MPPAVAAFVWPVPVCSCDESHASSGMLAYKRCDNRLTALAFAHAHEQRSGTAGMTRQDRAARRTLAKAIDWRRFSHASAMHASAAAAMATLGHHAATAEAVTSMAGVHWQLARGSRPAGCKFRFKAKWVRRNPQRRTRAAQIDRRVGSRCWLDVRDCAHRRLSAGG